LNHLDFRILLLKIVVSSEEGTMFARVKKSGNNQYLQIVENRRDKGKVIQRVIATLGRLDQMTDKGEVESLISSLSRFSERTLLILSDKSTVSASAKKIGPALIFERLWKELGVGTIVSSLVADRKFGFSVERALFLTVLHHFSFPVLIVAARSGGVITGL
jgi:hypothetical protein